MKYLGDCLGNLLWYQVLEQCRDQVRVHVCDQVSNHICDQFFDQVWYQVRDRLNEELYYD
jgi:hypothetical protein